MAAARVKVVARTRPTNSFAHDLLTLEKDGKTVSVHFPKNFDQLHGFTNNQQQEFSFPLDRALHQASQEAVYSEVCEGLVSRLLSGLNGTVLAYGETGAGKTYSMTGPIFDCYQERGVIPRAIAQVFQEIRQRSEFSFTIRISYLEIYNEVINDLLTTLPETTPPTATRPHPHGLVITEDSRGSIFVKGLTLRPVSNEEDALNMLFEGETNRVIDEHSLNKYSSRSHCVFTIHVESRSRTNSTPDYTVSKLNLVDLAGSERLGKTNSQGTTLREAMYINKSLSFLEQVVVALGSRGASEHVPYRQSKLTHLLQDSLGGNSETVLVANVWAEAGHIHESLSTLRFASRMMGVACRPVANVLQDPAQLVRQYQDEVAALKQELAMHDTLAKRGSVSYQPLTEEEVQLIRRQVEQYMQGTTTDLEIVNLRQVKEIFVQFKEVINSLQHRGDDSTQNSVQDQPSIKLPSGAKTSGRTSKTSKSGAPPPPAGTGGSTEGDEQQQQLVGDSDATGFGLGVAPSSVKQAVSPVAASRKSKAAAAASKLKRGDTKPSIPSLKEDALVTNEPTDEGAVGKSPIDSGSSMPRPSTPPTKAEAFEQFKKERGSEINKILLLNKESLYKKRRAATELSTAINQLKREIDQLRASLESRKEEEEGVGPQLVGEAGSEVIDEQHYARLTQLKQLKAQYRSSYQQLTAVLSEVQYCQCYVEQTRGRLLTEFELWYSTCFLGGGGGGGGEGKGGGVCEGSVGREGPPEVEQDASSVAFHSAQLRTQRRGIEHPVKRKAGLFSSSVRNQPPGLLAKT